MLDHIFAQTLDIGHDTVELCDEVIHYDEIARVSSLLVELCLLGGNFLFKCPDVRFLLQDGVVEFLVLLVKEQLRI